MRYDVRFNAVSSRFELTSPDRPVIAFSVDETDANPRNLSLFVSVLEHAIGAIQPVLADILVIHPFTVYRGKYEYRYEATGWKMV